MAVEENGIRRYQIREGSLSRLREIAVLFPGDGFRSTYLFIALTPAEKGKDDSEKQEIRLREAENLVDTLNSCEGIQADTCLMSYIADPKRPHQPIGPEEWTVGIQTRTKDNRFMDLKQLVDVLVQRNKIQQGTANRIKAEIDEDMDRRRGAQSTSPQIGR